MKEKPILFSGPMVRAILDGRKTQTRRLVKPQPPECAVWVGASNCPYGRPGDQLWVRETWAPCAGGVIYRADAKDALCAGIGAEHDSDTGRWHPSIHMRRMHSRITLEITAVRIERLQDISESDAWAEGIGREGRPLEALVNTCIAFPNLNIGSLAADDPSLFAFGDDRKTLSDYEKVTATSGRGVYAALWEGINGPGEWADNPYVWVVEFKRIP